MQGKNNFFDRFLKSFLGKMTTIVEILTGKGDVQKLYTVAKDIVELKKLISLEMPEVIQ